jgi:hypothetical protein
MGSTPFLFKSVVLKIIAFCQVNHVFFQVNYDKHSSFEFLTKTSLQISSGNLQYVPNGRCRIPKQRNFLSNFSNFLFVPKSEATSSQHLPACPRQVNIMTGK